MKYQLVLQLPASSIRDYDEMVEIEEAIITDLGNFGKVDGHDVGSGEMNIFIFTDYLTKACLPENQPASWHKRFYA